AVPSCRAVHRLIRTDPGGQAAPDSSNAMAATSVQRIVYFQFFLHQRHSEIADRTYQKTNDKRRPDRYEPCSRSDRHKAYHKACRRAHKGRFPALYHIDQYPGKKRAGGRYGGSHKGMGRKAVCLQGAPGVEAEPAEPEHGSSQNHKRDIMYTVSRKFIALPSSQNNGKSQGADSRTDMH